VLCGHGAEASNFETTVLPQSQQLSTVGYVRLPPACLRSPPHSPPLLLEREQYSLFSALCLALLGTMVREFPGGVVCFRREKVQADTYETPATQSQKN
jgi:hypothetical protein